MKDHPLTALRDSNLMRLLAPQVKPCGCGDHHVVSQGAMPLPLPWRSLRPRLLRMWSSMPFRKVTLWPSPQPRRICGSSPAAVRWRSRCRISMWRGGCCNQVQTADSLSLPKGGRLVLAGSCSAMNARAGGPLPAAGAHLRLDAAVAGAGRRGNRPWHGCRPRPRTARG